MVTKELIDAQLKRIGVSVRRWGAAEMHELQHILAEKEEITEYVQGWYESGFATLLTTTERLLLIDKKMFTLTIEDVRYDMIAEVDFNARLMDSTVRINTLNKVLRFTSMNHKRLRSLTTYVQQRVMQLRQQQHFSDGHFGQVQDQTQPDMQNAVPLEGPGAASPTTLPIQPQGLAPMRRFTPLNHYTTQSLTTKHVFLPRVPSRRYRPTG